MLLRLGVAQAEQAMPMKAQAKTAYRGIDRSKKKKRKKCHE